MTYDFSQCAQRSRNPIERDPMFQKMNEEGIIVDIDLDNLIWFVYRNYCSPSYQVPDFMFSSDFEIIGLFLRC